MGKARWKTMKKLEHLERPRVYPTPKPTQKPTDVPTFAPTEACVDLDMPYHTCAESKQFCKWPSIKMICKVTCDTCPKPAHCPAFRCDARCGPNFGMAVCKGPNAYCNLQTGWCGKTAAHKA